MTTIHCLDGTTNRMTLCGISRVGVKVASEPGYLELTDGELEGVQKCEGCEKVRLSVLQSVVEGGES